MIICYLICADGFYISYSFWLFYSEVNKQNRFLVILTKSVLSAGNSTIQPEIHVLNYNDASIRFMVFILVIAVMCFVYFFKMRDYDEFHEVTRDGHFRIPNPIGSESQTTRNPD